MKSWRNLTGKASSSNSMAVPCWHSTWVGRFVFLARLSSVLFHFRSRLQLCMCCFSCRSKYFRHIFMVVLFVWMFNLRTGPSPWCCCFKNVCFRRCLFLLRSRKEIRFKISFYATIWIRLFWNEKKLFDVWNIDLLIPRFIFHQLWLLESEKS